MIKFEKLIMPAASMGTLNPMPDIKNISYIHAGYHMTDKISAEEKTYIGKGMISTMLPYQIQDGYDREKKNREFNAAILENSRLKVVFLPELGGRLWSVFDKEKNRELLYVNPVFQPGNLALRNAWFSGGVEFNVGIKGHNPLTCEPMWCAVNRYADKETLCLYEYERIRGVVYSITAYLPEDSPVLYLKCRIENKAKEEKYMYWWSNIAVPETKSTRVIVPAEESFLSFYNEDHYVLDKASVPVHEGLDISYPGNIPSSRDFFYKIPKNNHKWIAAVNEEGKGLLQCSTNQLIGRKLFVWGQSQGGRNWNEWLSEEGSSYIEIQAGLANTQLEHIPMKGNDTWEWIEAYTAFDGSAEALHGDYKKAVSYAEEYMLSRVGNPDAMEFPSDEDILESEIVYNGSGWGALEELVRGESISDNLKFPQTHDKETAQWVQLAKTDTFPVPNVGEEPTGYVTGDFWMNKLESLPKQSWYSLLHIGVIKYANDDVNGAKTAWEDSLRLERSSWALRNLSMIYKNEFLDMERAREHMLWAFELKKDCRALCNEVAALLTETGDNQMWLDIYNTLSPSLQSLGRLRLYCAVALMNLSRLKEATEIINEQFIMSDIKEGELSVSHLWFELYRRLYAEEMGYVYDEEDKTLMEAADKKYPLPKKLDFRMHD